MKLYYSPGTCSLADHIVLEWIGQPYDTAKLTREQMKAPEYLKVNPAGAVPAFEDDGWVLTQNVAILNYLTDKFPDAGLHGDGTPKGRAEVNKWLAFANSDVHPTFNALFGGTGYLEDEAVVEKTKAAARKKLRGLFEHADKQLADHDWIAGTRSIVDPYLFVVTRWAKSMGVDLSGLSNLERFFNAMKADSAVGRVLKEQGLD